MLFFLLLLFEIDPYHTRKCGAEQTKKHLSHLSHRTEREYGRARERYLPEKKNTYAILFLLVRCRCLPFLRIQFFLFILFLPILVFVCYMYFFLVSSSLFWMCLCICMLRSSYVCFFVRCFIFILVRIFLPFILIRIYELDYSMENKKRIRRNRREKNENSKAKDGRNEKRNLY